MPPPPIPQSTTYLTPRAKRGGGYTVRDFGNLCHMVGFPICDRDLPENEPKFPHFSATFDH